MRRAAWAGCLAWASFAVIGCGSSDSATTPAGAGTSTGGTGLGGTGGSSSVATGGTSSGGTHAGGSSAAGNGGGKSTGGASAAGGHTSAGGTGQAGTGQGGMGAGGAAVLGDLTVWTSGPGHKIQPTTAPGTETTVSVETYRDAYVSAQLAIYGKGGTVQGVNVALAGDLSDGKGNSLTADNVTFFLESFIDFSAVSKDIGTGNTPVPASSPTMDGNVPDPLVPLVDPYTNANAAQPFDVPTSQNQGVFIDVHVPKGLAAGTYTGTIQVTTATQGSAQIPISVTVWALDLPDMREVTTHFKMTINNLFQYHSGLQSCSGSECYEDFSLPKAKAVLQRYEDLAHAHRIDIGQGNVNVPVNGCTPPADSDWASYDAQMQPYMDGTYFSDGISSSRFDVPFQPGQTFGIDGTCSQADYQALSAAWATHLASKGWFPKPANGGFGAVAYAYDEPLAASSDPSAVSTILNQIVQNSSWLQAGDPGSPSDWKAHVIDTTSPVPAPAQNPTTPLLDQALGVYVVALVLYDNYWDHGPFYGRTGWQQTPGLFNQGLSLWFYEGNSILPPYPTFATNTLDALEPVIMMWGSWFEKASGFLFWDIAYWTAMDPWGPETSFGKTGDGVLIYPGNHDGTLSPAGSPANVAIDGPVASYRLKMIRQGLQDWALFRYADKKGQTQFVQDQVSKVYSQFGAEAPAPAGSPYWTTDETMMAGIRSAVVQQVLMQ